MTLAMIWGNSNSVRTLAFSFTPKITTATTRVSRFARTPSFATIPSHHHHHNDIFASCVRLHSTKNNDDDNNEKARLVFLGTPDVAAASLLSLIRASKEDPECCFEVVGVVSQPPKRRKRRGKLEQSPVGTVAEEYQIPLLCPEKAKDKEFLDELEQSMKPDICITAAYGQWLPKRFLAMPRLGTLNIHPSLLPRWRGASPVQRSLEAGDNPIGVSLLYTVSKMDAGPIVSQSTYSTAPEEYATDVLPHLFGIGTNLLLDALPRVVSGDMSTDDATAQNEEEVVDADKIEVEEGLLRVWQDDATVCHNKVRAFSDWPGTYMYFRIGDDDEEEAAEPVRVKVIQSRVVPPEQLEEDEDEKQTSVDASVVKLGKRKKDGLMVTCADGSVLELLQIQPATKKVMDARSYVNGLRGQQVQWVETDSK